MALRYKEQLVMLQCMANIQSFARKVCDAYTNHFVLKS
jgi:hypothetical protein